MRRFYAACAAVAALAAAGGVAHAAPTGTALATSTGTFDGTGAGGNVKFTGTFNEGVYSDSASSGLDFVFSFTNSGATGTVESLSVSDFTGFNPTVSDSQSGPVNTSGSGIAPSAESVANGVANFSFVGAGGITAGMTTDNLIVMTSATSFNSMGTFAAQDGGNGKAVDIQPAISAAPEPSTWALMLGGVGLLGLMLRGRRARRRDDELSTFAA